MKDHSSHWRFRIRLALALLPVVVVFGSVFAQHQGPPPVSAPGQTANMTGKGGFVDSADRRVTRIRFEAGARTYLHVHTTGQVIAAEEGQGLEPVTDAEYSERRSRRLLSGRACVSQHRRVEERRQLLA